MNNVNNNRVYYSFLDYGDVKSGKRNILPPPSLLMFERCNVHDVTLKHGILLPDYIMFRPSSVQCDIDCHGDFISNGRPCFPLHCNELNTHYSYLLLVPDLCYLLVSFRHTSCTRCYRKVSIIPLS